MYPFGVLVVRVLDRLVSRAFPILVRDFVLCGLGLVVGVFTVESVQDR